MVNTDSFVVEAPQWCLGPSELSIVPGEVHLWRVDLAVPLLVDEVLAETLSDQETSRAGGFINNELKRKYANSHLALRKILSKYQDCPPHQLDFSVTKRGKPYLDNTPLQFNLSHSGELALVAVAVGGACRIGVDVECVDRQLDVLGLAQRFFTHNEHQELQNLTDIDSHKGFFAIWTLKEAFVKATGEGLYASLTDFEVTLAAGKDGLVCCSAAMGYVSDWNLMRLSLEGGYAGALAVSHPSDSIKYFEFDSAGVVN
jgi:4'-phosphopantetheinyl transferase